MHDIEKLKQINRKRKKMSQRTSQLVNLGTRDNKEDEEVEEHILWPPGMSFRAVFVPYKY